MRVIKIAGMALLFVCFSLCGYFAAERLTGRAKTLEKICAGIRRYQSIMSLSGLEVAYILPESFEDTGVTFTGASADIPRDIPLNGEEKSMLARFFEEAGTQDREGEIRRCEEYLTAFEQKRKAAKKTAAEKRKIYLVSGVCAAVGAVVLFI